MLPSIRTDADLEKVIRIFQLLAPSATCASDAPELFNAAKWIALDTLRHETVFHITLAPRGLA
ncbi:MAG: hypothetical protein U0270_41175 [Labilithrix sp.]